MGYESAENHDFETPPPRSTKPVKDMLVIVTLALAGIMLAALLALGSGCAALENVPAAPGVEDVVEGAGKAAQPVGYVYLFDSPAGNMCSAVAVSPTELFVAEHCLADQTLTEPYVVRHLVGDERAVRVVDTSEQADIALLELVDPDERFPLWASIAEDPAAPGDPVISIGWGCLKGKAPLTSPGLVTGVDNGTITVGVKVCPGDSGGGLFSVKTGELLGVTTRNGEIGGFPMALFVMVAGEF